MSADTAGGWAGPLRQSEDGDLSFDALFAAVRDLVTRLEDQVNELAARVRADVDGLARVIAETRRELRELAPEELRRRHLAVANGELDAVARHLEEATNEILDACEAMERLLEQLPERRRGPLLAQLTRIYEACSFHDISGQRIRKVVDSLEEVERRLRQIRESYRALPARPPAAEEPRSLLNGPALPGQGTPQEEIDALLGHHRNPRR